MDNVHFSFSDCDGYADHADYICSSKFRISELMAPESPLSRKFMLSKILTATLLLFIFTSVHAAQSRYAKTKPETSAIPAPPRAETHSISKNSWRNITPLRSTSEDVARELGLNDSASEGLVDGPFKLDDGEVSFSYLTPSLAKLYRAPSSMVGKVFTIYFKPSEIRSLEDLRLPREYRKCAEQMDRYTYYFVSDAGVAYQLQRGSDKLEMIIYQPSRVQVQRLAVTTGCIF